MRTYYFDMKDGVPIRDRKGLPAGRFSHDYRLKNPIHSIIVIDESGAEIHREPVEQDVHRSGVAITFEKIGQKTHGSFD